MTKILATVAFAALLFAGCKKYDLKFRDTASKCRILMMTGDIFEQTVHREFFYNEAGNPIRIEYVETEGGTGTPNTFFEYNDKQQLIAYKGFSEHRLFYNALGQVVIDSVIGNYAGNDSRFEDKYYYDLFGRIIKVVSKFYYDRDYPDLEPTTTVDTYRYDQRGNLIIPGVTYDTKTSLLRTNAIWMFLTRNYSLNNPVTATTYNTKGLPLTLTNGIPFFESSIIVQRIDYSCPEEAK
jgi:hypothetical protein